MRGINAPNLQIGTEVSPANDLFQHRNYLAEASQLPFPLSQLCTDHAESSNEDSDNREGPGEGESPSEPAEEEATLPFPRSSCPLSSGSITALWGPRTSVRWHQQMQIVAIGTNSLFYSWAPSVGPVHALAPRCGQGNIISGSAPVKKRTFYSRS